MDLLYLLIDSEKFSSTCFLCYKPSENLTMLKDFIEFLDEKSNFSVSLNEMVKDLFPEHDFILNQACGSCTNLTIKMYILLRRHTVKKSILNNIIDMLTKEVSNASNNRKNMLKINLNLKKCEDISMSTNKKQMFQKDTGMISVSQFKCKKCEIKLNTKEELKQHKRLSHTKTNDAIICDVCGKLCRTPNSLKAHLNCHTVKQCPYCFKTLKTHSHLKLHIKNHESNGTRKIKRVYYNCKICIYRCLNKSSLEAHVNKLHEFKRPYKCQVCTKSFFRNSSLMEHIKIHEKDKNKEMCQICGESFVSARTLSIHLLTHSGEKPFKCECCDRRFVTSGRKLEHVRRMHGAKTEVCTYCDQRFGLKKDLRCHVNKVHKGKTNVDC